MNGARGSREELVPACATGADSTQNCLRTSSLLMVNMCLDVAVSLRRSHSLTVCSQASLSAGRRPADFCWLPACVTSTHGGEQGRPLWAQAQIRAERIRSAMAKWKSHCQRGKVSKTGCRRARRQPPKQPETFCGLSSEVVR